MKEATPRGFSNDRPRPSPTDPEVTFVINELGVPAAQAIQIIYVQGQANPVVSGAQRHFRERFADSRIAHEGHIEITIVELTEQDSAVLEEIAGECGVAGWIRAKSVDRASTLVWPRLSHELRRLKAARPGFMLTGPTPGPEYRHPPFEIQLAPWAEDVAEQLHHEFGNDLQLQVGRLPYPPGGHVEAASSPPAGHRAAHGIH